METQTSKATGWGSSTRERAPEPPPPGGAVRPPSTGSLTPQDQVDIGRAARARITRSEQAVYDPPPERDPIHVLEQQSASRLPELVPVRYARMLESPFRFYRGAASLMAADLAHGPHSGLFAQLCGDAHMLNFRLLASPERQMVFDINDFDETLPGPWEWDLKRLVTSLVIAGRANGFSDAQRRRVVLTAAASYREWVHRFAGMRNLQVWYAQADMARIEANAAAQRVSLPGRKRLAAAVEKARGRDNLHAFNKLTVLRDGQRRLRADPPLLVPLADLVPDLEAEALEHQLVDLLRGYGRSLASDRRHLLEQYRFVDVARKVVGVGSVGTRCWVVLMMGRDDQDPLLLQVKEAGRSVLAEHLGDGVYANQGQRVVAGQRLMQAASDVFLGFERVEGIDGQRRDFYVRQLQDGKGIAVAENMTPPRMRTFAQLCGATLARAHSRSGDRIALAAYLGRGDTVDQSMVGFAEAYADQNERDHRALGEAVASGRISAAPIVPTSR